VDIQMIYIFFSI